MNIVTWGRRCISRCAALTIHSCHPSIFITHTNFIVVWHALCHYNDVIMDAIASQNTSLMIVYSTVYSDADQRKHQSSASLAFGREVTGTGEIPAQMASNAEKVSIWWRHHVLGEYGTTLVFLDIIGPLWEETTGIRWISPTKGLWCGASCRFC